jgi:SulP family sulfate permease
MRPVLARFAPHFAGTRRADVVPDALAGLTIAALGAPQAMAFALIAGVPVEMGILAAAVPALVGAAFGSSRFLVTGPTNANALVIGAAIVAPSVAAGAGVPVADVLGTALLAGLVLAALGLLGFGRASRFLSDSVVAAFALGPGILIALRQLPTLVGVDLVPTPRASTLAPSTWPAIVDAARALAAADPRALALGAAVPAIVLVLRRVDPRIPGALIALAGVSLAAAALGWTSGPDALDRVGQIGAVWPELRWPAGFDPRHVAAPALAIALLCTVQSVAAARTLASVQERLDPDRELFAQGVANLSAAVTGAIPTSGSLTRSSLARMAGAKSRLASAVSGLAVAGVLPLAGAWLDAVPLPALAGLVVLSGFDLVRPRSLLRAAATRGDTLVLVATLGAVLWIDLVQAIYVGLFLSMLLLVRRAGRLQLVEIVQAQDRFREIPLDAQTGRTPAVLLHLEGDLNFAVAPELGQALAEIAARGPRVLVLRLKRARHLDATVLETLRRQFHELRAGGATVIVCGLTDTMAEMLARTELGRELGEEGLLRAGARLFEGFERALQRTRALLGPRPDEQIFRCDTTPPWSYEI